MTDECPECTGARPVSRRRFLQAIGVTGAAVAAPSMFSAQAAFAAGPHRGPVLVVISLRGGMDGLSLVPPVGDPDYAKLRPSIAVPQRTAIPTGDPRFGLHPALAPLRPLWDSGRLSFVHAVASADTSRSHFNATAELERSAPWTNVHSGWLDRVLRVNGRTSSFEGVALGTGGRPGHLVGESDVLTMRSLSSFTLAGPEALRPGMIRALRALHSDPKAPQTAGAVATLKALDTVGTINAQRAEAGAPATAYPANSALGAALADAAALIRADVGLAALAVEIGGWDMHIALGNAGEGQFAALAGQVAAAIAAFGADLGKDFDRVNVVTMSEFGRRAGQNGSGGVDHGHGNAMLLAGGGLVGRKVHGRWPGLGQDDLDQGDLAATTDYRDVLAEFLVRRAGLGRDAVSVVFPNYRPRPVGAFRRPTG
ncbi:DUF1501 domain-containing protein [Sporichthya polymorpha]|uniref:DUF1501 domain-containing protein n=1 Tax=Sporichthya polymorpha TaxID=35751 RepID=UPI000381211A|nr:DUF1501 domain-containing protein [Sporichthya polymorpha]